MLPRVLGNFYRWSDFIYPPIALEMKGEIVPRILGILEHRGMEPGESRRIAVYCLRPFGSGSEREDRVGCAGHPLL